MSAPLVVELGRHDPKTGKRFLVTEAIPAGSIIAVLVQNGSVTVTVQLPEMPSGVNRLT